LAEGDGVDLLLAEAYRRQASIADWQAVLDEADLEDTDDAARSAKVARRTIQRERAGLATLLPHLPTDIRPLFEADAQSTMKGGDKENANNR